MKAEEIAQWVIDNRFPKSKLEKITDFEMYYSVLDSIESYAKIQIEKDRERIEENAIYIDGSADIEATHNNTPIILD